ncbi:MAG: cysteine hydrolase family protein [Rubrivivax sp.]|nr:cysteine hydrolase family protein [Rubrivivax sp.]
MTTALLVIDMQEALCAGPEAAFGIEAVLRQVNGLMQRARAAGAPVFLVQHEEDEGLMVHGTPGWQLATGLASAADDLPVRKRTPNAFHGTALQALLQARGITRLAVCGLQTDFCVDTTVRQALALGYAVALAADAHSTTDGVIRAEQAIAHHNHILRHLTHFGPAIEVRPSAQLAF